MMTTTTSKLLLALVCTLALTSTTLAAENGCSGTCSVCAAGTAADSTSCTTCTGQFFSTANATTGVNDCQAATLANCLVLASTSTCTICDSTTALKTDNTCVAVAAPYTNCERYAGDGTAASTCTACTGEFAPAAADALSCIAVATGSVTNCAAYSGNEGAAVCEYCKTGFVWDGTACTATTDANTGCGVTAGAVCSSCAW